MLPRRRARLDLYTILLFAAGIVAAILAVRRKVSLPEHVELVAVDEAALTARERQALDALCRELAPLGFTHALSYRPANLPVASTALQHAFLSGDLSTCALSTHSTLAGTANALHFSTRFADGTEVLSSNSLRASRTFVHPPSWRTTRLAGASAATLLAAHEKERQKVLETPVPYQPSTLLFQRMEHEDASTRYQAEQGLLRLHQGQYRATLRFAARGVAQAYNPLDGFTAARLAKGLVLAAAPAALASWKFWTVVAFASGHLRIPSLVPYIVVAAVFAWSGAAAGALFSARPRFWALVLTAPGLYLLPGTVERVLAFLVAMMFSQVAASARNRREQVVKTRRLPVRSRIVATVIGIGIAAGLGFARSRLPGKLGPGSGPVRFVSVEAQVPATDAAVDALNDSLARHTPRGEQGPEFLLQRGRVSAMLLGPDREGLAHALRILQETSRSEPALRFAAQVGFEKQKATLVAGRFDGPGAAGLEKVLSTPEPPPPQNLAGAFTHAELVIPLPPQSVAQARETLERSLSDWLQGEAIAAKLESVQEGLRVAVDTKGNPAVAARLLQAGELSAFTAWQGQHPELVLELTGAANESHHLKTRQEVAALIRRLQDGAPRQGSRTISTHPELAPLLDGEELTWLAVHERMVLDARGNLRAEPAEEHDELQLPLDGETVVREHRGKARSRVRYVVGGRPGPWLVNPRSEQRAGDRVAMIGQVDGAQRLLLLDLRTLRLQHRTVDGNATSVAGDGTNRLFVIVNPNLPDEGDDERAEDSAARHGRPPALLEIADGQRRLAELDEERFGPFPALRAFSGGALWVQGSADLFRIDARTGSIENVTASIASGSPRELLRAEPAQGAWVVTFAGGGTHVLRGSDSWDVQSAGNTPEAALSRHGTLAVLAVDEQHHRHLRLLRRDGSSSELAIDGLALGVRWRPSVEGPSVSSR